MRIPNDLHVTFDRANQFWSVPDAKFSLDGMPVQLKRKVTFLGSGCESSHSARQDGFCERLPALLIDVRGVGNLVEDRFS